MLKLNLKQRLLRPRFRLSKLSFLDNQQCSGKLKSVIDTVIKQLSEQRIVDDSGGVTHPYLSLIG